MYVIIQLVTGVVPGFALLAALGPSPRLPLRV